LFSRPSLSWSSPLTVAGDTGTAEPWGYCPKRSNDAISGAVVQDFGAGHLDTEKPRVVERRGRCRRRRWTCGHGRRQSIERDREQCIARGPCWLRIRISSRCCRRISGCRWKEIAPSRSVAGVIPTDGVSHSLHCTVRGLHCRATVRARAWHHPHPDDACGRAIDYRDWRKIVTSTSRRFEIRDRRRAMPGTPPPEK